MVLFMFPTSFRQLLPSSHIPQTQHSQNWIKGQMVLTFCQLCLTGKNIRNPKKRYLTKNLSADHMIIVIVRIPPMISDNCDLLDLSDDQMILMNDQVSKPKTIRPSPPGPSTRQPRLQEGSLEADRWASPSPLHIHQGEQTSSTLLSPR